MKKSHNLNSVRNASAPGGSVSNGVKIIGLVCLVVLLVQSLRFKVESVYSVSDGLSNGACPVKYTFLFHGARVVRDVGFQAEISFKNIPDEWHFQDKPSEQFDLENVKVAIKDLLSNETFIAPILKKLFDEDVMIGEIDKIEVSYYQEGAWYGVFKVQLKLKDSRAGYFILNTSKGPAINFFLPIEAVNLETLHDINPEYVVEVFNSGYGYSSTETERIEVAMFAVEMGKGIELHIDANGILATNPIEIQNEGVISPTFFIGEVSDMIKKEMIKILTVYYAESNGLAICYRDPESNELNAGISINAGDFIIRGGEDAKPYLTLISARFLEHKPVPKFIQDLLTHSEYEHLPTEDGKSVSIKLENVFEPRIVFLGIIAGLIEVYGQDGGSVLSEDWFDEYRNAVLRGEIDGFEFLEELEKFL